MSLESVKNFFRDNKLELSVIETNEDTATVDSAALALGVEPNMIAKTMAFQLKEKTILILSKGKAKTDNKKFKETFREKPKMLSLDLVEEITGHPIGGVCPFGLKNSMDIYLDISLKEFETVYPAGGTPNSAVKIAPDYLEKVTNGVWIDISKEELPE